MAAGDGFEQTELLALEAPSTLWTGDVLPEDLAGTTADPIPDGERFEVVLWLVAGGTNCEDEGLLAAAAVEGSRPLVNESFLV